MIDSITSYGQATFGGAWPTLWALTEMLKYTGQSILDTYDLSFTTHELRRHPATKEPPLNRVTCNSQRTLELDHQY